MIMLNEINISINGHCLSNAESMTIRVAIESFYSHLFLEGLGDDETGKAICRGYMKQIRSIRKYLYTNKEETL